MSRLYSVGELLIDFQSVGTGSLKDTRQFVKNAGGAPANVCVQAVRLGQRASYLTKVGNDGFGEFLIETLNDAGVDTSFISKSEDYDTSLAFVSFSGNGEREFTFYRRNAADLHFLPQDFEDVKFRAGDVLEFGSVALAGADARSAHRYLIEKAEKSGAVICFDPNLRFNLWNDKSLLKDTIKQFASCANVIKVGVEELEFITGLTGDSAVKSMFKGNLQALLVTDGGRGAKVYLVDGREYFSKGYKVNTVDTTGAGDSFFGAFIAQLMECTDSPDILGCGLDFGKALDFACKCGAYTTTGYGAIPAIGNKEKIEKAVK